MDGTEPLSLKALLFGRQGRIGRRTWWLWAVAMPIGLGLYFTVLLRVAGVSARVAENTVNVLLFWPVVAVSVKRWHDRDKSGWWVLVNAIPVVGWIWAVVENGMLPGRHSVNRFGPPPTD